ncbi:MAG: hypothetical protein EPO32_13865 [Anaerolineae bacterium]|nr:MAG: hypothetical protein EPO32_13865 [Anaerolineae bacterium]
MGGLSRLLDVLSEYLAHRKGLLPGLGILLVLANLILGMIPGMGFLAESDLLLHLGVVVGLLGLMLARAL